MNEKEKDIFEIWLTQEIESGRFLIKQAELVPSMKMVADKLKRECGACVIVLGKLKNTESFKV